MKHRLEVSDVKTGNYPLEYDGELDRNRFSGGAGDKNLIIGG